MVETAEGDGDAKAAVEAKNRKIGAVALTIIGVLVLGLGATRCGQPKGGAQVDAATARALHTCDAAIRDYQRYTDTGDGSYVVGGDDNARRCEILIRDRVAAGASCPAELTSVVAYIHDLRDHALRYYAYQNSAVGALADGETEQAMRARDEVLDNLNACLR